MNKNHSTFQIQKSRREAKKKEREAREAEERRQQREAAERERRLKEEAEAKLRMTPQQNQPLMVGSCSFSTRNLLLYLNRYELGLIAIEKAKNMLVFYVEIINFSLKSLLA